MCALLLWQFVQLLPFEETTNDDIYYSLLSTSKVDSALASSSHNVILHANNFPSTSFIMFFFPLRMPFFSFGPIILTENRRLHYIVVCKYFPNIPTASKNASAPTHTGIIVSYAWDAHHQTDRPLDTTKSVCTLRSPSLARTHSPLRNFSMCATVVDMPQK